MIKPSKKRPVYEHLEFWLEKTSYADRFRWLEEANEFVRWAAKVKRVKPRKGKSLR